METLHKKDFDDYIQKYSRIITNQILFESELNLRQLEKDFDPNHKDFINKTKLEWENLDWNNYWCDHECRILSNDYEKIEKLTRAFSKYMPDAISRSNVEDYKNFISQIFLKECYINAILEYTEKYSEKFDDADLLNITREFFSEKNHTQVCEEYFSDLG